ncbi:hypothetical protein [Ruania zhangjianzhongii]|uniref:YqeB family protein n=1 Tax=Ruania zhangjianzhongii TaxID=2603206 RepID=UPI0011C8500E|nr:hypothetical protein [Ruania zhangjianzhongii]
MEPTELRQSRAIPALFGAGVLALGAVVGVVAGPAAARLVALIERTPIPSPRLLEVLAELPLGWTLPIGLVLGAGAGVLLAGVITHESLKLTVSTDGLEYRQKDREGWLDHHDVASVHRDGRYAVVCDRERGVLARLDADGLSSERLRAALQAHGYRWLPADPFDADYRRWQDGRPAFTDAEHRLIRSWRKAGKDEEERAEAEVDLRAAHLAVRERDGRIQVRRTGQSRHGTHRRPATP